MQMDLIFRPFIHIGFSWRQNFIKLSTVYLKLFGGHGALKVILYNSDVSNTKDIKCESRKPKKTPHVEDGCMGHCKNYVRCY